MPRLPTQTIPRRDFLKTASAVGATVIATGTFAADAVPKKKAAPASKPTPKIVPRDPEAVRVAVLGMSGRGTSLCNSFAQTPAAMVTHVCDVDAGNLKAGMKAAGQYQESEPQGVEEFRRILDDKSVDAVIIATPDHWHAPMAILACQAGKHVYVEKPCSHNPREGEMLAEVAEKTGRLVQHGTQRRSWPKVVEAIERLKAGEFGKVVMSRGWYANSREETGKRTPAEAPKGLNWDLWQGPAPKQPYTANVVHYKWHWFWHWGTGELGNNGVHALDVCRWGLGVDFPDHVTAGGGRYHFQDDQESPDTLSTTFTFGDKVIFWEGRSCNPRQIEGSAFGAAFYGDKATLIIDAGGYQLFDPKGKELEKPVDGPSANVEHVDNFLQAIRGKAKLNAPISEGVKSSLLCHLGNMAWRTGGAFKCDPSNGHVVGNDAAAKLWSREYDPAWQPKV